jgi:aminoglycoside phosphotransferase (APT) family kinase protein
VPDRSDDADAIHAVLRELLPSGIVESLERLTGGASRSTWRCIVDGDPYVVQRQRADTAGRDMRIEAAALAAAARGGVPVPRLVGFVADGSGASSLVTRHVAGETIARRILRDERFDAARAELTRQLGEAAARLHAIDPVEVPGLDDGDPLQTTRDRLDELGQPHPAFELALRWLADHRPPPSERRCVVHGDFRLGNVIVDERGLAAVLDWELVHLGDPVEDLGWLCSPAWRFGGPLPVAGIGRREQLLDAYEAVSGVPIPTDTLRWWEVFAILRWGVICIGQADAHRSGAARSHELAAIGRRVCETEHDLFLALDGRW